MIEWIRKQLSKLFGNQDQQPDTTHSSVSILGDRNAEHIIQHLREQALNEERDRPFHTSRLGLSNSEHERRRTFSGSSESLTVTEDVAGSRAPNAQRHSVSSSSDTSRYHRRSATRRDREPYLIKPGYPAFPRKAKLEQRLATFEEWSPSNLHSPLEMAKAGFWYSSYGDMVFCYHCGGSLAMFEPRDNVVEEHKKYFPHCTHVKLIYEKPAEEKDIGWLECKVCLENSCNVAFIPCGHVSCSECVLLLSKCPICRSKFKGVIKIFF